MNPREAIVSYGIIPYAGANEIGMWNDEATFSVTRQALDAVGLSREDVDSVVISTMDGLDGITISNGLLAPAGDSGALAEAMCRALGDPALLDRLSRAARPSAERFAWGPRVAELEDLCERLQGRDRPRDPC